ncbi:MAG: hypothetical protein QXU99_07385 [Candidatus Bathyarchaeia archaeon]
MINGKNQWCSSRSICSQGRRRDSKNEVAVYVKSVLKLIFNYVGGTEYGSAASFREITRAIVRDTREILSVPVPIKFSEFPEPIFIGLPTFLGRTWFISVC